MAGKRPGGAGGRTQDGGPGKELGRGAGRAASPAQVERALSALEELVVAGRAEEIPRWTAVLWSNRSETQRLLLRRLESGLVRVPGLYFDILSGLGGERAGVWMRQVAGNRNISDLLRMEARRRAGWPERTEPRARAAFWRTLRDPAAALGALVAMGCSLPVPDGEAFTEALGYLLAVPAAERVVLLSRLAEEGGGAVSWLLRALLAAPDAATCRLAAEEVLALRDRGAMAALDRLERLGADPETRASATVALRRLAMEALPRPAQSPEASAQPAGGTPPSRRPGTGRPAAGRPGSRRSAPTPAAGPLLPFDRALVTAIDGSGGQAVTLFRRWDEEARLCVQVFFSDAAGIGDAYGLMRLPSDQAEEMLRLFRDRGCPLVGCSLAEARALVQWAAARTLEARRLPPPVFSLWEPYFFDDLRPTPPLEAPEPPCLGGEAAAPSSAGVAALLASPFCDGWRFSAEQLAPVEPLLREAALPGPGRYPALLRELCPPQARVLLASRLRRQAWLLDRSGQAALRDAALGAAVGLERLGAGEPADLPILRGLLARGLAALREQAGLDVGAPPRGGRAPTPPRGPTGGP